MQNDRNLVTVDTATATPAQRVFLVAVPSFLTLILLFSLVSGVLRGRSDWLAIGGCALSAYFWYSYSSIPRRVTIAAEVVTFESLLATISVPASDIRGIDARLWNRGFVIIAVPKRKIFLLRRMPGLLRTLKRVGKEHPTIAVRGSLSEDEP